MAWSAQARAAAIAARKAAADATAKANLSGRPADHKAAGIAHRKAADLLAHHAASFGSDRHVGLSNAHSTVAARHEARAAHAGRAFGR